MSIDELPRTALITGASRGIGRAVAEVLAEDGFDLFLMAHHAPVLEEFGNELSEKFKIRVLSSAFDIADLKKVHDEVHRGHSFLGSLGVVFNNAGINYPGTLTCSSENFAKLFEVNVLGAFAILQAAVPLLRQQGSGYIFNMSSIAGKVGFASAGAYCASKFALSGLSESLFRELAVEGIKVTALCPSWVDTEMASHGPKEKIAPRDIAETVRYLLRLGPNACVQELVIGCRADLV